MSDFLEHFRPALAHAHFLPTQLHGRHAPCMVLPVAAQPNLGGMLAADFEPSADLGDPAVLAAQRALVQSGPAQPDLVQSGPAQPTQLHSTQLQSVPPLPEDPAELELESPRRKRGWQIGLAIVLIVAIGYAVTNFGYFMARTFSYGYPYAAGKEWTYDGMTFKVLDRELLHDLPGQYDIVTKAEPGAIFVVYHIKVTGYHYDPESRKASNCEFSLQGDDGQQWNLHFGSSKEEKTCDFKNPAAEQEIYPVFQIPQAAVPDLKGLKLRLADPRPVPLLREPQ